MHHTRRINSIGILGIKLHTQWSKPGIRMLVKINQVRISDCKFCVNLVFARAMITSILKVFLLVAILASAGTHARKFPDYADEVMTSNGKTPFPDNQITVTGRFLWCTRANLINDDSDIHSSKGDELTVSSNSLPRWFIGANHYMSRLQDDDKHSTPTNLGRDDLPPPPPLQSATGPGQVSCTDSSAEEIIYTFST
ncbi:hypothetical protein C2S52_005302 [Perilla frutescens var. hirtella]|nr:hypothetical protein C2S52_005302 [Perilla frutescens var. hirtella]